MRLIDADWAERKAKEIIDGYAWAIRMAVGNAPTVDAVPLDKLCEWLELFATMDCEGCREAFGGCEDEESPEVSVCNSRERWKAMLTKWMEGLDADSTS